MAQTFVRGSATSLGANKRIFDSSERFVEGSPLGDIIKSRDNKHQSSDIVPSYAGDILTQQKRQRDDGIQMFHIGYVASVEQPDIRLDDQAWVDILRSWGHVVSVVAWNDPKIAWKDFNTLITRLTYHHLNPTGFRCWLNLVDSLNHVIVLNPTDVHRWNQDKRYLQQLELNDIPIIPTVWLTRGADSLSMIDRSFLSHHKEIIVKPTISSVARGLSRIDRAHVSGLREIINQALDWSDVMVQPFIASIESCGEIRCIFLGQEFSHAIQKLPLPGDFRTNISDQWKLLDRLELPEYDAVVTAAREALEAFLSLASSGRPEKSQILFAAVDMVLDADRRPLLIELEMTDPCLYLKSSHGNLANLFAKHIISNVAVNPAEQYTRLCGPHRLIFPWHGPEVLFVRQALQNPSSVALISDIGPPVTYRELCRRAVCIDEYISTRRFTSIAILCQRTSNLVSTILGCMFARLPYLLLNNSIPVSRIEAMLKLSGTHHVLCENSKEPIFDRFNHDMEVSVISDIMSLTTNVQTDELYEHLLCREPMEERINNLIFTSGSTGVPKGIRIRYQALTNVVQHFIDNVLVQPYCANVVFAHSTNTSFDLSAIPFFIPLAVGGRIAFASDGCMRDPKLLKVFLYSSQSNYFLGTTSQYRLLIESGWVPTPDNVCIQAGEVLSQKVASRILDGGSILWNFYGPAETTIWSTACRVKEASDPISIGLPIWNTEVIFLDDAGDFNNEGEICIAGNGLGQYIVGEETHKRFQLKSLPGTIPECKTTCFYHTGDLARYSNGSIVYRGRLDTQIKIDGQRVELQEIELTIKQHPKVSEAVVKHTIDDSQEGRLVAFVAPVLDTMELKGMLAKMLPQYMVPSNFIFVENFPLNSSGKADGRALIEQYGTGSTILPSIKSATPFDMASSVHHTKKLQDILLTVFCQKLGLQKDQLNVSDNIFDYGTTSILAIGMATELSRQLGMNISVAEIFENPSASRLGPKIYMNHFSSGGGISRNPTASRSSMNDIAVISSALRCPSANLPEELWHILMSGKDTVCTGQFGTPSPRLWIPARTSLTNSVDFDRILFDMTKNKHNLLILNIASSWSVLTKLLKALDTLQTTKICALVSLLLLQRVHITATCSQMPITTKEPIV